jgi:hypothetical protein
MRSCCRGRDQGLGVQCGPRALSRAHAGCGEVQDVRARKDHNQRWGFPAPEVRERYAKPRRRIVEHGGGRRRPVPDRGRGGKSGALPG